MREEKTKYYVIKEKAVPEVLLKVIEAKRLMDMQELTVQQATEKAISFLSVSFASSILPAPRSCPTMMDTAFPMEIKATLNRLEIVDEMFRPAITASPLME